MSGRGRNRKARVVRSVEGKGKTALKEDCETLIWVTGGIGMLFTDWGVERNPMSGGERMMTHILKKPAMPRRLLEKWVWRCTQGWS